MSRILQVKRWVLASVMAGCLSAELRICIAQTNSPAATPGRISIPSPPPLKSPVESFRELLAMSSDELAKALAGKPAEQRQAILDKIREYKLFPPEESELRLQSTELRWYLLPAMEMSVSNRSQYLALIPERMRKLVEERLKFWDIHPPPMQKELLEKEHADRIYAQLQISTREQRTNILASLPSDQRERLEAGYDRFRAMSEAERHKTFDGLSQFFNLTQVERQKILRNLSDTEVQQMQRMLTALGPLSEKRRMVCIQSFARFISMNAVERREFLNSAKRWDKMPDTEREAWRKLVSNVPPSPAMPPSTKGI
jgi:hypothetical protein